jgi:methylmalonyl-CoA mutase
MAGSGGFEDLTDQLARVAWARFNAIEAAGGIIAALREGIIAKAVAADRDELAAALAARTLKVVGVTDFRREDIRSAQTDPASAARVKAPDPRMPGPDSHCAALAPMTLEGLAA